MVIDISLDDANLAAARRRVVLDEFARRLPEMPRIRIIYRPLTLKERRPGRVLEYDTVPVRIFERTPRAVQVRIIRSDRSVPRSDHSVDRGLPFLSGRKIKHQQIFLSRRTARSVIALSRELEMVGYTRQSEHHAVEALVILEDSYLDQPHTISIEPHNVT
jgi:hypothetical protein